MDKRTLKSIVQFSVVIGLILAMFVAILAGLGTDDDFVDAVVIYFIGAGFAVIGLACAPFLLIGKDHYISALKDLALPIGLIMSCYLSIVYLGDFNQSKIYFAAWLPAVAGGMISLTLADADFPKKLVPVGNSKSFLIWLWIICICHIANVVLGGDPFWNFSHWEKWILCFSVIYLFYLYNPKQTTIFQRISLGAVAAIILSVSLSTLGVGLASQEADLNIYGLGMAWGFIGTIYGSWIHITSLLIGRLSFHYDVDSNRTNWHLAEIFTFFIILNMGPKTMFEVLDEQEKIEPEQPAVETSSGAR